MHVLQPAAEAIADALLVRRESAAIPRRQR